jgi:hypothetical protein
MNADSIVGAVAARERNRASLVAGAIILLDAAMARVALTADDIGVSVFGHRIPWECSLRRIGLPCPTCGMTRSVVMALHGEIGRAWHVAPGGPVLAAGSLILAVALLGSPFRRAAAPRWLRAGGVVYGAAAMLIWLGGWAAQFARAWRAG